MDYRNLPVAKRTRRGQELYWKELYEKNRKNNRASDSASVSQPPRDVEERNGRRRKSTHGSKNLSPGSSVEYVNVDDYDESEEEARAYESLDFSDEAEEANAGPPAPSKHRKRLGKRKSGNPSKKWMSVDDSDDGEEATAGPSTGPKRKEKVEKRKSCEGSKKWRSGSCIDVSDDGEVPSVEIIGEDSCGENDSDPMDFDEVQSAGSKNDKTSKFGSEKTEKSGPLDLEDSDSDVVYLGEEEGGGGRGFASDSSCETETLLCSEEESAHSDDEDYDPEESESSGFSEESSSSGGDDQQSNESDVEVKMGQSTDKCDIEVKKGNNVNEREKRRGSWKAGKRESVEDNVVVKKVHNIDEREIKKGFGKEGKGKSVEDGAEVEKGQHFNESKRVGKGKQIEDENVEVKKRESFDGSEVRNGSGIGDKGKCVEDDNVEVKGETVDDSEVRKGSGKVEVGMRRKRRFGLDTDAEVNRNKDVSVHCSLNSRSVAQRTRSQISPRIEKESTESVNDRGKTLFDEQDDIHKKKTGSVDRRNDDKDETYGGNPISGPDMWNDVQRVRKKNKGVKLTNRQSTWETKDSNVFKILVDSIYEKGEVLQEGSDTSGNEAPKDERNRPVAEVTTLPLKFTFGSTQPSVPEKQEMDPEEKELWDDLDFALRSCEISSTGSKEVENQDSLPAVHEEDAATLCKRGSHQLILDEEIGLRCKFCTYLDQEIKYIVPEFVTYPCERFGTRGSEPDNLSIFDVLQSHDSGSDPHSDFCSHVHAEGTVWDCIPGVKSSMYPHQREGFEFIWNHIAGGIHIEELKRRSSDYSGNGCIISHAPGTGKTRLTIVFLQTYLELFPECKTLLIAPRSMLLTWEEEFRKWEFGIPFHNLNNKELSGEENETAVNLMMQIEGRRSVNRVNNSRILKLFSWSKKRSILGISYQLFEKLSGADHSGAQKTGLAEELRKILVEIPGLVVFDEGHTPRNEQSHIWKAVSEIKTPRRILLSGTPFQNNFQELYNTICLVRPTFADSIDSAKFIGEWRNRSSKSNVDKWQWTSVADCSGKVENEREKHATEVKAKIAPFVNVYKGSVLQDSLPGLRNSVVVLRPTQLQKQFHKRIQVIKSQFGYEYLESIISIHPSLLLNEKEFSGDWDRLKELKLNPDAGVKTKFLIELIRLSDALSERVLVFSQYINPLIHTMDILRSKFHWTEGEEVVYMDGKCDMKQRQSSMNYFNDPSSKAKVLLASTKGCCEGISLVGASRVVLLDVTWNPSVERQAISRAYRLGQKKVVYVYHLLMGGTNEEQKYKRQVDKSRLSELVFSDSDRSDALEKKIRAVSKDRILEEMAQHHKLKHIFESIALLHEDIYFEQLGL